MTVRTLARMPPTTRVHPPTNPRVLTVDEAASILRISRTTAYELAHEYLRTNGSAGLPALRLGRLIRIPRWAVDEMISTGRPVRRRESHATVAADGSASE